MTENYNRFVGTCVGFPSRHFVVSSFLLLAKFSISAQAKLLAFNISSRRFSSVFVICNQEMFVVVLVKLYCLSLMVKAIIEVILLVTTLAALPPDSAHL